MAQRGRPAVFVGSKEARIVGLIEKFGLTGARAKLASYKTPISISLPTLGKLAERNGVELKRGRRAA
jgi:hypothetical protein